MQPAQINSIAGHFAKISGVGSLHRNVGWALAGNVVYAACQWGMLVVLAKLGSPEHVGRYALGLALTAPVILFANLHLRAAQVTDARFEYSFGEYLGLRLATTGIALIAMIGIVVIGEYSWQAAWVILILGLAKGVDAISDVFQGLFQQRERMDYVARTIMTNGILSLAALTAVMYLTGNIVWAAAASCLGSFAALSYCLSMATAEIRSGNHHGENEVQSSHEAPSSLRPHWDWRRLLCLTRLALPLGIVMLIVSLNTNVSRLLVEHNLGESELGVFAAIAYLVTAGMTVTTALGQSASPRLALSYSRGRRQAFTILLCKLLAIGATFGVAGVTLAVLAGPHILALLYTQSYSLHANTLVLVAVAAMISFVASFLGFAMTAARRFSQQVPLFLAVFLVTTATGVYLIPDYGLNGAALSMVAGAAVQLTGSAVVVLRAIRRIEARISL